MPDPESFPPLRATMCSEEYRIQPPAATPSLQSLIEEAIRDRGPLPFTDFMELALYHPELGYYARETRQVGRGGDFFTSVSVGPLFGNLLARRFLRWHSEATISGKWRILECGAHDGTLALDVLQAIEQLDATAFSTLEYAISEPLPRLRAAQAEKLADFSKNLRLCSNSTELENDPLPGIIFGNELLDALPFHLIEMRGGSWKECLVGLSSSGEFVWEMRESIHHQDLLATLAKLGSDFPDGYRTEIRTCFPSFFESLKRCVNSGLMVWPDYGFAREDHYNPQRTDGTLRTFSKHRAAENPLENPGEIDITAHVDFTAVAEAASNLGWKPSVLCNQGSWLTKVARDWLLSQEGNMDSTAIRQFQTLTHPAHLGAGFQILELTRE